MVIVFHSVILQRAQGVNNFAQICKRILFRLNCCNFSSFDELVKYTYNSAMRYLRKTRGNQMEEQCHRKFLNLVLKGKLREAVQLVCDKGMGEFCNHNNWLRIVQARSTRLLHGFLGETSERKNFLLCHVRNVQGDAYFYSRQNYGGSRIIGGA